MFGLGIWEVVIILVVVLIVFGVGKLPDVGSGLGQGIRNFRKALRDDDSKKIEPGKSENSAESKKEDKEH
jgi:sec-independent protein translocase protein TatA